MGKIKLYSKVEDSFRRYLMSAPSVRSYPQCIPVLLLSLSLWCTHGWQSAQGALQSHQWSLKALGGAGGEKTCWTCGEMHGHSECHSCTCSTLCLWLQLTTTCVGKNLYTRGIQWDISLLLVLLTPMNTTAWLSIKPVDVPLGYKVDKTKREVVHIDFLGWVTNPCADKCGAR